MANIFELLVGLGIDSDGYERGIAAAGDHADNFVGKITGTLGPAIAGAFAVGGAAVAGFATASVAQFADFQASMNEVFTLLPGISDDAMGDMTDQVKDFSKEFGVLPDKVVPALYQSLSAGVPADNVFNFLEAANKAATAGVTELETAVDGISSVVNAYGADTIDATKASDLMFTAVKLGKTNFDQLSSSLFNVTPTAAAAGVGFDNVTAALAAMTLQGVPTSVATTQLRSALVELSKDGTKTSDLFEKLAGKSFKEFEQGGGNLQQALQILETHAKATGVGINDLFGSVEAGNAALALTGRGTEAFSTALAGMQTSAGATDAAFATMNTGITDAIDDIKAGFAVFMLDVGERLAPVVQMFADFVGETLPPLTDQFLTFFDSIALGVQNLILVFQNGGVTQLFTVFEDGTSAVSSFLERFGLAPDIALQVSNALKTVYNTISPLFPIIQRIGDLIADNWQPILIGVAAVIGGVVVSAIVSMIAAVVSIAAPIVAAVAIVALMYKAYTENFLGIQTIVNNVITFVSNLITKIMTAVSAFWLKNGDDITTSTNQTFNQIFSIVNQIINDVYTLVVKILDAVALYWKNNGATIMATVSALWSTVSGLFKAGLNIIEGIVKLVTGLINGDWQTFADGCAQIVTGLIDGLHTIFTDGMDLVKGAFDTGIEAIRSILLFFVGDTPGIGTDIINGIIDGIKAAGNFLIDTIKSVVGGALQAAKDFLGIHSPSDVMYDQVGQPAIEGITNAFLDGGNQLASALSGVLGDALDAARSAIKEFQSLADFGIDLGASTVAGAFQGGGLLPHFASGVTDFGGGLAVVGEQGPEVLDLPRGTDVYPNSAIGAANQPTSGVTQQFNIDAHYKTVQDEMTLRDRIRLESQLNMPTAG